MAAAVLSGNRNFEGRIQPLVKAVYLASPPLVVAYALAGAVDIDLTTEPLGTDRDGRPVYLEGPLAQRRPRWRRRRRGRCGPKCSAPATATRSRTMRSGRPAGGRQRVVRWDPASTYIQEPPFLAGLARRAGPIRPIHGARVLLALGDSVTTDHISPAGAIAASSPAGKYLQEQGVGRWISTATARGAATTG